MRKKYNQKFSTELLHGTVDCIVLWILVRYSEGPLFWKFTIPTKPKADPNPKPNPNSNLNLSPNLSTVARICTMDFRNSGPSE